MAQRAKEESMGLALQDLNPVSHQTKASFTPGKSKAVAAPPQPSTPLPPKQASVQRVARIEPDSHSLEPDGFAELEADLGQGDASAEPQRAAPDADMDVEEILKRFKGSPEEIAKQLAKSYSASEKRMRQLEAEKNLLVKQGVQPVGQPQPVQQAAPVMQQVRVQPTFDFKKAGDKFLDAPDQHLQNLAEHIQGTAQNQLLEMAGPIYEELIDARLFRKFPDVVTDENLDVIKAMAHTETGNSRWEKVLSAAHKYKTSMSAKPITQQNAEVQAMQQAAQTPSPQARTSGDKKMYKQSYLQELIQNKTRTGEYQRDPKYRRLIDTAYREGRVLRGQ
jgi:hypothetical protein